MAASYGLNHFLPNYQSEPRLADSMHSLTSQYHDFNSWSKSAAVAADAAENFTESVKASPTVRQTIIINNITKGVSL
jgi:GH25 family lysozyme M1 (1,4-beta-N-acetylmuramidase)